MNKELVCTVAIFVILLIDPLTWHYVCCKLQFDKELKYSKKMPFLFGLMGLFLLSKILSQLIEVPDLISYFFENAEFLIFYFYATKLLKVHSRIAVCFISIFNFVSKIIEYVYTLLILVVMKITSPSNFLQPNFFRVLSFFVLHITVSFILVKLSNININYILMFREKRVYHTFFLILCVELSIHFASTVLSSNGAYDIFNSETLLTMICEIVLSLYSLYIVFLGTKREHEMILNLDNVSAQLEMLQQEKTCTDNIKKLLHDSNNHISTIGYLLEKELYNKALEYIKELIPDIESAHTVPSEQNVLITMLYRKQQYAKTHHVNFDFLVSVPDVTIDIKDVSTLIFNMADNSIEYCSKHNLGETGVMYRIYTQNDFLIFECFNQLVTELKVDEHDNIITTKEDSECHGLGLRIMKECAEKYNGVIDIDCSNNLFVITATFSSDYVINPT